MKTFYPEIQPFNTFFLETGSLHRVYVEQSGNPDGIPVVFLHGGPCSGTKPDHRRFFNPERYHIILFDQRACGQSLPFGELEGNTTQDLIADMERIRTQLGIKQWLVFGGSWGGALALLYAQQHTAQVCGLVIRAVFLARQQDLDWYAKDGANRIFPEQWQKLMDSLPGQGTDDVLASLCDIFWSDDIPTQTRVAKEWLGWAALTALGSAYQPKEMDITDHTFQQIRMELNFAKHHYFITENQILNHCKVLQDIPTCIIHGRQDFLCPMEAGMKLKLALPQAEYVILPNAGHVAQHEEMIDALITATDAFAETGGFGAGV
jgi:proline iminopeptidase